MNFYKLMLVCSLVVIICGLAMIRLAVQITRDGELPNGIGSGIVGTGASVFGSFGLFHSLNS